MNWLDTQTKEFLQRVDGDKLAPSTTAEFALVLLRRGPDYRRIIEAIMEINKCNESEAAALATRSTPVIINPDLSEGEAIWGQFELICCDAVSIYLRSEVIEQNDKSYLWPLFKRVSDSAEFKSATVSITHIPETESGYKFLKQFTGISAKKCALPMTLTVPFKKARIMEHWAARVGVQMNLKGSHARI